MLTYTMDVEERSRWLITTPTEEVLAQPFYCTEVGDFYARRRFSTARSGKESFIVFYTLGGTGIVRQGGQEIALEKGHALLMDCRTPQSYFTSPERSHWYHLWTHIDGPGVAMTGEFLGLPKLTPIEIPLARVQPHFDTLFQYLEQGSVISCAITGAAVHSLLTELIVASQAGLSHRSDDPVQSALGYISAHYAQDVSLDDLARIATVSPSHLIRLFKRQMGTTPHDYLMRYRITRAKELLAETALTSAAIARQVGFSSESNFSYRFSKVVGQSPREYRQSTPDLVLEG
ncbi:MAG: helix-turn-helix domain-containing protein [Atopobiaceae bacterium]|nr:helix-turn-helix domain-containing protein [Atopobiaceae bacterium]